MSISQKIADIEAEIARTQKNKATEGHIGLLKAKIAKLKRELIVQTEAAQKGGGGEGFDVAKSGDSRVGLVGFPSVGKSTLLNKLTGQHSEVADYEFTTLTVIPGVIRYKGAKIQLLDLPGIIEGAKDGKGRGRQVIAVARSCSLILIVLDAAKPMTHKIIIEKELEGFGIRLNKKPPEITIKRKDKGGLNIVKLKECPFLDDQTIKSVCQEYRLNNADIMIKQSYAVDEFIDVLEGNRTYIPCLYVLNKIDQISIEELDILDKFPHCVPISAHHEWNLDSLVERMWHYLDLIRIYTKPKGFMPDLNEPVILPKQRSSVQELCNRLHKQILKDFKYAIVWGQSVKHIPQKIGKDHVLLDEDVIQIVKRGS